MPTKEDIELYEEAEGVSKTKKPKPSEKITLLDGIKWLDKIFTGLIPVMKFVILLLITIHLVIMLKNEEHSLLSIDIDEGGREFRIKD